MSQLATNNQLLAQRGSNKSGGLGQVAKTGKNQPSLRLSQAQASGKPTSRPTQHWLAANKKARSRTMIQRQQKGPVLANRNAISRPVSDQKDQQRQNTRGTGNPKALTKTPKARMASFRPRSRQNTGLWPHQFENEVNSLPTRSAWNEQVSQLEANKKAESRPRRFV